MSGLWATVGENEKKTFSHGVYMKAYTSGVAYVWRVYADCSFFLCLEMFLEVKHFQDSDGDRSGVGGDENGKN